MEIEAPLLPQKQEQPEETIDTTEQSSAHVFEKPKNVMKHRPAPVYDIHKKNSSDEDESDEETNETEEDDDDTADDDSEVDPVEEDDEDDDEDDEDDEDDDDDDETGTDGGEEDENEFVYDANKPLPQQKFDPNLLRIKQDEDKNKKKKVTPHGPEKVDRSPWQQMVDFLVHGAKEAMIKNGDMPIKPRLSDKILLGLGLKSIKEDILLAEGAEKFWKLKGKGEKASMRLINTDRISKKVKKEENRLNKPRKLEEKRLTEQQRYKNHIERIMKQRRDKNIRMQMEKQGELTRTVREATQKTLANNKQIQAQAEKQIQIQAQQQAQIVAQSQVKAQQQIQEQIKQSATKQAEQQRNQQKLLGLTTEINQLKTPTRQDIEQNTIQAPQLPKTEAEKQATPKAQETKARKEGMETAIVQSIQNNIQAQNQANIQNNIQAQQQANVQNNLQAQNQATMQNIQAQNQATMQNQLQMQNQMDTRNAQQSMVGKPLTPEERKQLATLVRTIVSNTPKNDQNPKTQNSSSNNNTPTQEQVNIARKETDQAITNVVNITVDTIAGQGANVALAEAGDKVNGESTTPLPQNQKDEGR